MKRFYTFIIILFSFTMYGVDSTAQYLVNFEGETEIKPSYASATVNLSGIDWDMTEALIGNSDPDWKVGLKSARLRGYGASGMTMLADKSGGIGSITFSYPRYGNFLFKTLTKWQGSFITFAARFTKMHIFIPINN